MYIKYLRYRLRVLQASNITSPRLISFGMYILGFVWFVLSLVKKYYLRQFSLFAWTHVALLCVVTQSYLIIQNMFEGLIWFIMPIMMVIINDVMAYMFGFTMGRTPLIQLSPKKTWEGFIGERWLHTKVIVPVPETANTTFLLSVQAGEWPLSFSVLAWPTSCVRYGTFPSH